MSETPETIVRSSIPMGNPSPSATRTMRSPHVDDSTDQVLRQPPQKTAPPQIADYRILEFIGAGGMGAVWKAEQISTHRIVALKVLPEASSSSHARARFDQEVTLAARLEHPSIARIYDSGFSGVRYCAMQFIEGTSLDKYLSGKSAIDMDMLSLLEGICRVVQYAHEKHVIHRDLKPSNIMITPEGIPVIIDFGLARPTDEHEGISIDGDIVGTPAYMSPEQAAGRLDEVHEQTDIYSLGVILYIVLTGELPFRGSPHMIIHQILNAEPDRPRLLNDQIPADLEAIILKAINKEPARRYQSAGAMADDLRRFINGKDVLARPTGPLARLWLYCQHRERIVDAGHGMMGLGIVFTIWNSIGIVLTLLGVEKVENRIAVVFGLLLQAILLFIPMYICGKAILRGKLWGMWCGTAGGAIIGALLIGFMGRWTFGIATMGYLAEKFHLPLAVLNLFLVMDILWTLRMAASLLAWYSNRRVLRWSHEALKQTAAGTHLRLAVFRSAFGFVRKRLGISQSG